MMFSLPDDQQVAIISEWIDMKALAVLDTALCSSELRNSFLNLTQSDQCIFSRHECMASVSRAKWALLRKLKFRAVTLYAEVMFHAELSEALIAESGKTLQELSLNSLTRPTYGFEYFGPFLKVREATEAVAKHCYSLISFEIECETSHVSLGGALTQVLVQNESLANVNIGACDDINNVSLAALLRLPYLWCLAFTSCTFCDSLDLLIAHKSILCSFSCTNPTFAGGGGDVSNFCNSFPELKYLDATGMSSAQLVSILPLCPHLDTLYLLMTEPITDELAQQMTTVWPKLDHLHIHYAEGVTCSEEAMMTFVRNCPQLISLNLVSEQKTPNFDYNARSLPEVSNNDRSSKLYELYVDSLSRGALIQILAHAPRLHELAIHHREPYNIQHHALNSNISVHPAETALDLVANSSIQVLHLHNVTHLTSESLNKMGHVEELYLSSLSGDFNEQDLLPLVARCPALHTLFLAGCTFIDFDVVTPLLDQCPTLRQLRYWNRARKERYFVASPELQLLYVVMQKTYPHLTFFDFYFRQSSLPYEWE